MISRSSSRQQSSQTATTQTQNLNLQDIEGIALANSNNNVITTTDHGTVAAAERIASDALYAVDSGFATAGRAIDSAVMEAFGFGSDALSFADRASERSTAGLLEVANDAFSFADKASERAVLGITDATNSALLFANEASEREGGILKEAFDFGGKLLEKAQASLGETVTSLNKIAREQATSDAQRVEQISTRALWIGAAVSIAAVLAFAFKARG